MTASVRVAVMAALLAVAFPVAACGYHGNAAVGALNVAYPNALWVRTAVWQAQLDGLLARANATPPANPIAERLALAQRYREVSGQLTQLRDHLSTQRPQQPTPTFTVLLMGPMMWSRFELNGDAMALQVHADGPVSGDVVLITDEPVLAALATGRMRLAQAVELGVVLVYGPQAAAIAVSAAIETWRPTPTPAVAAKRRTS